METSLVAVGCCALANDAQTSAYSTNLGCRTLIRKNQCCGCDIIPDSFACVAQDGSTYTTPANDYAIDVANNASIRPWWYDPLVPESGDVAGLWITSMEGFESTYTLETQQALVGGQVFGIGRNSGRCVTVTGWIDSASCCGARYMVQALQRRLQDACDQSLFVQSCCPTSAADAAHTIEVPGARLTASPKVLDRRGRCCPRACSGTAVKVQWTWCFPNEDMYLSTETICAGPIATTGCVCDVPYWIAQLSGDLAACGCPQPVAPVVQKACCPQSAPVASLPQANARGCYLAPFNFAITPCELTAAERFYRHTAVITITAGVADMENVRILAFQKQFLGETCAADAVEWLSRYRCATPILDIRIPALVAYETLIIDGINRAITATYPGAVQGVPAWNQVELGPGGATSVMSALDLGSCDDLCVYIMTDCNTLSPGATFSISLRPSIQSSF